MDVRLVSRRRDRALAVQKLQHALPAVGLLLVGPQGLKAGARGFELALGLVEVTTSVLLIATILRSLRQARALGRWGLCHAHGVDWIDIWAAAVLFAEAAERWHLARHIARPTILMAIVTLARLASSTGAWRRPRRGAARFASATTASMSAAPLSGRSERGGTRSRTSPLTRTPA